MMPNIMTVLTATMAVMPMVALMTMLVARSLPHPSRLTHIYDYEFFATNKPTYSEWRQRARARGGQGFEEHLFADKDMLKFTVRSA